jgi:tetratricopeptide (TPR) repeat protein
MSLSAASKAAFAQAVALLRAGRASDAEGALRALLAADPGATEALELLGATLGAQARHAEALAVLDRARDARPSSPTVRHNRAQALTSLGRHEEARVELAKALQLKPDAAASWNLMGTVLAALGDGPGAERAYQRALQADPALAEAHYNLGHLYQQAGRIEEAIACYRAALVQRAQLAPAHNNLANALKLTGRREEALAHYAEAVRIDPQLADALSNFGTLLREEGRFAEAVPLLERSEQLKPGSWAVLNNLGIAYHELKRDAEAVARYRRALELAPGFHDARNNLGNALAAEGDEEGAMECYRAVIAQAPDHPDAYSNLGLLLQERGAVDEAIDAYRKALALRADHADALSNLGYLLQEQGRLDEAIEYYRRAMEANPRNARAGYNLALAFIVRGDFARGWELHRLRFETTPPIAIARRLPIPPLTAADLDTPQRIALWREQGVGDQLLYSSLVPELAARGHAIVLEVDRRLVPAYVRAHPDWTVVSPEASEAAFNGGTRHAAVGSLAQLLRPSVQSFESQPARLLDTDPARVAEFRARLAGPGTRTVAISWRSFQPKGRGYVQRKKSAPLEAFAPLADRADLRLLDVQYGDTAAEREAFAARGHRLVRLEGLDLFDDLDGVLAAIDAIDLVVTTSNVTAHLAGALGKPTWLVYLAANPPFHYWVPRADGRSLWYPSVRIVTGRELDTWEKAMARVDELLDA